MRVLDERLQTLVGEESTNDLQAHSLPSASEGTQEDLRQLQEACFSEPYRQEDHTLTTQEMWDGFSSEDEPDQRDETVLPAKPVSAAASTAGSTRAASSGYADTFAAAAAAAGSSQRSPGVSTQSRSPQLTAQAKAPMDAGRLLEEACKLEPYRPEDHVLSPEEFWGGSSGSSDGGKQKDAPTSGQAAPGDPRDAHHLAADEMWGDWSDDDDAECIGREKAGNLPAASSAAPVPAVPAAPAPNAAKGVRFALGAAVEF
eukprot:TRINITY_DN24620_c0_g1_i1.p1 TRINITY_DN24620_c0_g1~~TRINITY_DN24620_c0_g1_i1.p1  ORF type:complete len:258 (-),score=64.11 TRINITY_DN24620_c0_g1_i1:89-862(-)